eukprot:m.134354 g.134354  ORF g.134354 m.134354 type:complete len:919 (+) comp13956_c1_seq2:270-3026(+)
MEAEPTVDYFLSLCEAFKQGGEQAVDISRALEEFRETPKAWEIANTVLADCASVDGCAQAALLMRWKILHHFFELPVDWHASLAESLVGLVQTHAQSGNVILKQLILALADLAVYLSSWSTVLEDVYSAFEAPEYSHCLLEFLTALPEEIANKQVKVKSYRRADLDKHFGESAGVVYQKLEEWIQVARDAGDTAMMNKLLKCTAAWLVIGGPASAGFEESILFHQTVEGLKDEELAQVASEVIEEAIYTETHGCEPQVAVLAHLESILPELVNGMKALFQAEDDVRGPRFARVAAQFSNARVHDLLENPPHAPTGILDMMSEIVNDATSETVAATFTFWFTLADEVYNMTNGMPLEAPCGPHILQAFYNLYQQLFRICMLSLEPQQLIEPEDTEYETRGDVKELLLDTCFMFPIDTIVEMLVGCFSDNWLMTENAMFMLFTLRNNSLKRCSASLDPVVATLGALGDDCPAQLRFTGIQLAGELGLWLNEGDHVQHLATVFQFLLQCLQIPTMAARAARSVYTLARNCAAHMGDYFDVMMQVVAAIPTLHLEKEDALDIVGATVHVVTHSEAADIPGRMNEVVKPFLDQAKELCAQQSEPVVPLTMLGEVFKRANFLPEKFLSAESHPGQAAAEEVWQLVLEIMNSFHTNTTVIEACNNCVKWIIRSLEAYSIPLVESIVPVLRDLFDATRESSCIYLTAIVVELLRPLAGIDDAVFDLGHSMSTVVIDLFSAGELTPHNNPDIVEDFFRLQIELFGTVPAHVFNTDVNMLSQVLPFATFCLQVREDKALEMLLAYVATIWAAQNKGVLPKHIELSAAMEQVLVAYLPEYGEELTNALLLIMSECGSHLARDVADTLYAMGQLDAASVYAWAQAAPALQSIPQNRVSPEVMEDFFKALQVSDVESLRHSTKAIIRMIRD